MVWAVTNIRYSARYAELSLLSPLPPSAGRPLRLSPSGRRMVVFSLYLQGGNPWEYIEPVVTRSRKNPNRIRHEGMVYVVEKKRVPLPDTKKPESKEELINLLRTLLH